MDKRGQFNNFYIVLILFIVLVGLFGIVWMYSLFAPLLVGQSQQLSGLLRTNINQMSPNTNLANATNTSLDIADNFLGVVESLVYMCSLGLFLGFIAVCYFTRTYKWLAIAWIPLMIGLVVISMILSNTYEQTANSNNDIQEFYTQWGTNHFLMLNLPYLVAGFGVLSGIILFAIASTSEETTEEIQ